MTALRIAAAAVLAAAAAVAALLAADVRAWPRALAAGDAVYAAAPAAAGWQPSTLLGGAAASLLSTSDDVGLRRALQLDAVASRLPLRLDDADEVEGARARAQDALVAAARSGDAAQRSQALTLLGVLAFGADGSGAAPDQYDAALSDFGDAVRADPGNAAAAYDLELLVRLATAHGLRVEPGNGGGFGRTGRRGAGGGLAGSGY